MDIEDIYKIEDETEQVQKIYEILDENSTLNHSNAAQVEFLTNLSYIER